MGRVLGKLASPVRRLLHLLYNQGSKKEVARQNFLRCLALLEKGEQDDHQTALALEHGKPLPSPTKAQKEMSKASFSELLEKFLVVDMVITERPLSEAGPSRADNTITRSTLLKKPVSVECVICRDLFEPMTCLSVPCGHFICSQCVIAMADVANKNEDIFPLQCCQQQFPMDTFLSFLSGPLLITFSSKLAEAATPPNLRVYCPNKECLNFIGRLRASTPCVIVCPRCGTAVCAQCKNRAHPTESCDDVEDRDVHALAKEKGWKACPKCKMIVERISGCRYIYCRCNGQFCYNCGKRWDRCECKVLGAQ